MSQSVVTTVELELDPDDPTNIIIGPELPEFLKHTGCRGLAMKNLRTVVVNGRMYAFRGVVTQSINFNGWIAFSRNLQFGYDQHVHFAPPELVKATDRCYIM